MNHEHTIINEGISAEVSPFFAFWLLRELALEDESDLKATDILVRLLALYALSLSDEAELSIEDGEDLPLGKIVFASTNLRKLKGGQLLIDRLNSIFKNAQLTSIMTVRVPGEEPLEDKAGDVATHKVKTLLEQMEQTPEESGLYPELNHRSVVFSSDVVARIINGSGNVEHLLNLSRITDAGELVHVRSFIQELNQRYTEGPFTLQYDIANAATMIQRSETEGGGETITVSPHIHTEAVRVSVSFRTLPPQLIEQHFARVQTEYATGDDLRAADVDPGINVGLPIFDQESLFLEFIESVQLESLSAQGDASWFEPYQVSISELSSEQKDQLFDSLMVWIAYGIAPTAPMLLQ